MEKFSNIEFWKWYKHHEAHFTNYTLAEICILAQACGFELGDIAASVTDWLQTSRRQIRLWESPFYVKWLRVALAQKGHDDIGEETK